MKRFPRKKSGDAFGVVGPDGGVRLDAAAAAELNAIVAELARLDRVSTEGPLEYRSDEAGRQLSYGADPRSYVLLGPETPAGVYGGLAAAHPVPGGSFSIGDPVAGSAYETNRLTGLSGQVERVAVGPAGDFRFQHHRWGRIVPPTRVCFLTSGCGGCDMVGARIVVPRGGTTLLDHTVVADDSAACIAYPGPGDVTFAVTADRFQPYSATVTIGPDAGIDQYYSANLGFFPGEGLQLADGFHCTGSGCGYPAPTILYATDAFFGGAPVPLTFQAGSSLSIWAACVLRPAAIGCGDSYALTPVYYQLIGKGICGSPAWTCRVSWPCCSPRPVDFGLIPADARAATWLYPDGSRPDCTNGPGWGNFGQDFTCAVVGSSPSSCSIPYAGSVVVPSYSPEASPNGDLYGGAGTVVSFSESA